MVPGLPLVARCQNHRTRRSRDFAHRVGGDPFRSRRPTRTVALGRLPDRSTGRTAVASAYRDPSSRRLFLATILIAVLDLAFFALSGTGI